MGFAWILQKLKEPSTYAGLTMLLGAVGLSVAPELKDAIVQTVAGIAGVLLIAIKEKK